MSIKKIQQLTGFSYSTISRVLNGKSKEFRISEETQRRIMEAADQLEYRPNILARSLRLKRTHTIGLIVPDIQNPFFGELAWRMERLLREQGYSTILCNTDEISENEEFYLKVLVDRQVDGIILTPVHAEHWDYLESIRSSTSVVLIDRIFFETDLPWVKSDNEAAAEKLTDTLIELGFNQIAFLGGQQDSYITTVRYQGYCQSLRKHGIDPDTRISVFRGYTVRDGEKMMESLVGKLDELDAIFCVNNLVFLGAMGVAQKYEVDFGSKGYIQLAAFDIARYCNLFKRPMVCANQNLNVLAGSAVSLMLDQINQTPRRDIHINLPIYIEKHRVD